MLLAYKRSPCLVQELNAAVAKLATMLIFLVQMYTLCTYAPRCVLYILVHTNMCIPYTQTNMCINIHIDKPICVLYTHRHSNMCIIVIHIDTPTCVFYIHICKNQQVSFLCTHIQHGYYVHNPPCL